MPWQDVSLGVCDAIRQIEQKTGWRLLDDLNTPIIPQTPAGDGVAALLLTLSAAEPLRVTLLGLMEGLSLVSAKRAIARTYTELEQEITLNHTVSTSTLKERLTTLRQSTSDVFIVVGGIDGGAKKTCDGIGA